MHCLDDSSLVLISDPRVTAVPIRECGWIAGLTVVVLAERVMPGGEAVGRGLGVVLLAWAVAAWLV